jgi:hypothetical protein
MEAKGGTELQYAELEKRLDPSYFKKFQITTSVPEKEPIALLKFMVMLLIYKTKNNLNQCLTK